MYFRDPLIRSCQVTQISTPAGEVGAWINSYLLTSSPSTRQIFISVAGLSDSDLSSRFGGLTCGLNLPEGPLFIIQDCDLFLTISGKSQSFDRQSLLIETTDFSNIQWVGIKELSLQASENSKYSIISACLALSSELCAPQSLLVSRPFQSVTYVELSP